MINYLTWLSDYDIGASCRGVQYTDLFLDKYKTEEELEKAFIEMCEESSIYFFEPQIKI